jgi:hypothetical protein
MSFEHARTCAVPCATTSHARRLGLPGITPSIDPHAADPQHGIEQRSAPPIERQSPEVQSAFLVHDARNAAFMGGGVPQYQLHSAPNAPSSHTPGCPPAEQFVSEQQTSRHRIP